MLFDQQAQRTPQATALRHRGRSISYAYLRNRSSQLAHYLRSFGTGPGSLVGICTDRSADMVTALLGIHKAGAAYVPLDPHYPKDRLAFMIEDAELSALVTQQRWRDHLPSLPIQTLCLDSDDDALNWQPVDDLACEAGPEDPAYVIYTSGSTGNPKGVVVRRCAFVNFLWAMKHALGVNERDVVLAQTTISFDIAGLEIFLPLIVGGSVVLASREDATQAARLMCLLEEEKVTLAQATPATWRMLLDSPWAGNPRLAILCGGEAMTRELADKLLTRGRCLWNMYGPTETTVWSTMCEMKPGDEPISIGRPINNTTVHILDDQLREVPVGEVGELHIGGVGLARGYLNRPDLTAEKFVPDPFSDDLFDKPSQEKTPDPFCSGGGRLYKTGDLARYLPDGRLECLGRVDHQVKVRGFRIELPEIEARLSAHPAVKSAAVVAREDGQADKYLVAYWEVRAEVGGHDTTGVTTEQLRDFLGSTLPSHMVPSIFVRMDALPLTPNGKIDRKALPPPDRTGVRRDTDLIAPVTETQKRLVEFWERLLGVKPIGIRDDFFALGGHSLAAARIVVKIESELSVNVPVATFLSARTVEALAQVIEGEVQGQRSGVIIPFRETGTRPPLFVVAGVGGHVFIFRELAELLGDDQPVYGLQGIGLDGKEPPLSRMEDIAGRYIQEILSIQPAGPYFIGGWSMGGVIAYEIARHLLAQGRELGRLIIIDAYAPWAMSLAERARLHLDSFRRRSWRSKLDYLRQHLTHRLEVLARRLGYDHQPEGLDGQTAERVLGSSLAQFEALRQYRPPPFPADLTLLRAEQTSDIRDPRADDPHLGWRRLVQGAIHVLPVSGSHTGIFVGQNVRILASALTQALGSTTEQPSIQSALMTPADPSSSNSRW
jgi:amino acid adenylation domain-containing protein